MLGGLRIPNRILKSDFLRVKWGTPPNVFVPQGLPDTYGPEMWVEIPGHGEVKFVWNEDEQIYEGYVEGSLEWTLQETSGGWCFEHVGGEDIFDDFCVTDVICGEYPENHRFIRVSGPPVDFRILRLQHQIDDLGHWHHTSLQCELDDRDHQIRL